MPIDNYSYEQKQVEVRHILAKACAKYKDEHNLTLEQFANVMRMSTSTLKLVLSEQGNPSLNVVIKIMAVTGCTIS